MANMKLPDVPGIGARGFVGDSDYGVIAALFNTNLKAMGVLRHITGDEVRGWLANTDDIDPDSDYRFIDVNRESVAYALAPTHIEEEGRRIYRHNCKVHPDWQGKGIGSVLLDWIIGHHTERTSELGPGTLQTTAENSDEALIGLLAARGYVPAEHEAELVRPDLDDIADRQLPEGLEIRPVTDEHLRPIWEADAEAFKDHWGARPRTEADWKAFLDFSHRDESMWKIAWDGDRIVGQVRGYVNPEENAEFNRKRGYAEFVSTTRNWRGRGVASSLICETLREFKGRGLKEAALSVHVENRTGAYSLYQGLGFEIVSGSVEYERELGGG